MKINIIDTDKREFMINEGYNYQITLYQGEIRRIIKILESVNSPCLAEKFKLMILIRDMNLNKKTDFSQPFFKGDFSKQLLSPSDFYNRANIRNELIRRIDGHFKKSKK